MDWKEKKGHGNEVYLEWDLDGHLSHARNAAHLQKKHDDVREPKLDGHLLNGAPQWVIPQAQHLGNAGTRI